MISCDTAAQKRPKDIRRILDVLTSNHDTENTLPVCILFFGFFSVFDRRLRNTAASTRVDTRRSRASRKSRRTSGTKWRAFSSAKRSSPYPRSAHVSTLYPLPSTLYPLPSTSTLMLRPWALACGRFASGTVSATAPPPFHRVVPTACTPATRACTRACTFLSCNI